MSAPRPDREAPSRPPAGFAVAILFDTLVPLAIGIAILAVLILIFLESSASGYPD